jgi:hypothetical protein
LSSFEKEFYSFNGFKDHMVITTVNDNLQEIIENNRNGKLVVVPISLHMEDYETKLKYLTTIPQKYKVSVIDEADFGPGDEEPALEVFNFGNGPALNVRCSWKIDAEQIVSLLNTYDPHHQRSIGFEPSPFVDEETMKLYWNHFYKRQIESLHNPIAPSSGAVTTTISLPAFYLESFHIYIRLAVHARPEKRRAFELKEFPKAVLSLSHHDLAGLGHTDIYDVRLHYSHNGTHRFENKNSYACELMAMKTS